MKRLLVACEYSGTVRDAFAKRGWDAWSCDLLPSERPGNHIQGDVVPLLSKDWDLIIAHPPCTYLSSSGMHWTTRGLRDPKLTDDSVEFVRMILDAKCDRIAVENPIGVLSSRIRKPDCIVQPYQFGHPESKATCLWLKNLPKLTPSNICKTPESGRWENQTKSGQNKLAPSPTRWKDRSRTYQGIADAMAEQWSEYACNSRQTSGSANAAGSLGAIFTWSTSASANVSDRTVPKTKDSNCKKSTASCTEYVLCEPDPSAIAYFSDIQQKQNK